MPDGPTTTPDLAAAVWSLVHLAAGYASQLPADADAPSTPGGVLRDLPPPARATLVPILTAAGLLPDRGQRPDRRWPPCTGLTAAWCPVHGDCTCPQLDPDGGRRISSSTGCPLHGYESRHADA